MRAAPTATQLKVLGFIHTKTKTEGWPPTHGELCDWFGWSSKQAAADHIEALERKGLVVKQAKGKARALRITSEGKRLLAQAEVRAGE